MATPPKTAFMDNNTMVHTVDERKGCRSLLCDASGIIIAEMVYRCMVCYSIHDFIGDVSKHYHTVHMNDGDDEEIEEDMAIEEEQDLLNNRTKHNNITKTTITINNNNNNPMTIDSKKRNTNHLHNQNNLSTGSNQINIDNNTYLSDHNNNNCDETWEIDEKLKTNSHPNIKTNCIQSNTITENANSPNSVESCTRSGYIHCPVCSNVRCYTTIQRRYGQFTCVACYRFFKEFFTKPTRYSCPFLGQCSLNVKSKCKACWIMACTKIYSVDDRRRSILEDHAPIKSYESKTPLTLTSPCPSVIINYPNENRKPVKSNRNRSDIISNVSTEIHSKSTDEMRTFNASNSKDSNNLGNEISSNQSISERNNFGLIGIGNIKNTTHNNDFIGNIDNYTTNSDLAGLSALNMLNILSCEEAVPECDELLGEIAEEMNNINNQLDEPSPQKMMKLDRDLKDDNNNNLNSSYFLNENPMDSHVIQNVITKAATTKTSTMMETPTTATTSISDHSTTGETSPSPTPMITGTPTSVIKTKSDRRIKARVKNWCCLKCTNCLADDCGKCINCLDRPKFGGPFVRKQRCVNKKCLEKIHTEQSK